METAIKITNIILPERFSIHPHIPSAIRLPESFNNPFDIPNSLEMILDQFSEELYCRLYNDFIQEGGISLPSQRPPIELKFGNYVIRK